jgi:hypothetical protein
MPTRTQRRELSRPLSKATSQFCVGPVSYAIRLWRAQARCADQAHSPIGALRAQTW